MTDIHWRQWLDMMYCFTVTGQTLFKFTLYVEMVETQPKAKGCVGQSGGWLLSCHWGSLSVS